jgi:hypothetical protein
VVVELVARGKLGASGVVRSVAAPR